MYTMSLIEMNYGNEHDLVYVEGIKGYDGWCNLLDSILEMECGGTKTRVQWKREEWCRSDTHDEA